MKYRTMNYSLLIVDEDNLDVIYSTVFDKIGVDRCDVFRDPSDFIIKLNEWSNYQEWWSALSSTTMHSNCNSSAYFLFYVDDHVSERLYVHQHFSPYIQERLQAHSRAHDILHEMDVLLSEMYEHIHIKHMFTAQC